MEDKGHLRSPNVENRKLVNTTFNKGMMDSLIRQSSPDITKVETNTLLTADKHDISKIKIMDTFSFGI